MKTNTTTPDSKGFRFPSESISHAVWLYFRFSLRFRDGEEILAHRGIVVTDETVGQWCLKFGQTYANELRRRPRCGDKWHMDEMVLTRGGKKHSGWRAVHQDGNVLDILVQSRSNTKAATGFFRKLLKGLHSVPRVMIPAKLKRYAAAQRDIVPGGGHRHHQRLNNRAENSPQSPRRREKKRRRFTSAKHAQRFLSADRAQRWAFPTAQAWLACKGIPRPFTGSIPGLQ